MNMLGHTSYSKHAGKLSLATVLMTVIFAASAAEINAEFSVGFGISDNIARTPANEVEENIGVIGFAFDLTERTQKTDVAIRSNFDYVDYQDDTFDSELVGRLDALLNFFLIDERLTWQVQNNYGQQLIDPLTPSRPDNRENVNYFTTGPTLTLPFGSRSSMGLELLYSNVNYEIRPFDNERVTATIKLGREIREDHDLERLIGLNTGLTARHQTEYMLSNGILSLLETLEFLEPMYTQRLDYMSVVTSILFTNMLIPLGGLQP